MAIPVYLQQFKAAGIYRVVFDKSTILNTDTETLRLVVGYSEKGPFNIPTYITSVSDFKAMYGDISKKLEKRGIFFHRLAIQALGTAPILCLNLKKFDGETVSGATINTDFNPNYDVIDAVKINVEDIYDTTRFWELSSEKLNGLTCGGGFVMDQYINICTTNTKESSGTYFIRKASGKNVNGYNITVSDWYSDEDMPEFLKSYKNSLISDFFAEVYVFKGNFTADQVLASSTLKNYFEIATDSQGKQLLDDNDKPILQLRPYVLNAYGDSIDTLEALYYDETSNAIGHYVGALIPYFKTKQNVYAALDIVFNSDQDNHNMMMSFNIDALEEDETAHIDLSGRLSIPVTEAIGKKIPDNGLSLDKLFTGTAKTTLLGNTAAPVITDVLYLTNNVVTYDSHNVLIPYIQFNDLSKKVTGTLYVNKILADDDTKEYSITLKQVGVNASGEYDTVAIYCKDAAEVYKIAYKLKAAYKVNSADNAFTVTDEYGYETYYKLYTNGYGSVWTSSAPAFIDEDGAFTVEGPQSVIISITRIEPTGASQIYTDEDMNMKVSIVDVITSTISEYTGESSNSNGTDTWAVYGSSISFIPIDETNWATGAYINGTDAIISTTIYDNSLWSILGDGDCLVAGDATTDRDGNGEIDDADYFYDNVYVQSTGYDTDEEGKITRYWVKLSGEPYVYTHNKVNYLVRIDQPLNQEIGKMIPQYLEGYTYKNGKPQGTGMWAKLQWHKLILSALTEYKGLRTALLNKANIDYRYIVDTFECYIEESAKNVLSYLAKEKQSAFAILNFPAVKTFVKCPYASFTDNKGVFNVDYIVKGYNKKKASSAKFSLPSDAEGASFCAFYSPLKFSDGYVDTIVPSAGLVSNLFMQKYLSRQPYYIIAGPNYGHMSATGLVGPDYTYSQDELQIIEPYGVNCMVYRSNFGTFINANQTAKQTPVSALSKVNVRELVIYIQDEIEKVLQAYQWEFNNATTRTAILDKVNGICARVAANGGIQAYLNVMDTSNNTPEIIDNEMAIIDTHIEPGMGCGKMVQTLTLYRTGQMSASIAD